MVDLPKAAHFLITQHGDPLPSSSEFGLSVRWGVAHQCREAGIDMLDLSLADRVAIGTICARVNQQLDSMGVVVQLRLE